MNYFDTRSAAERYVTGRPHFHDNTISHIKSYLNIENKLEKALDVACGTGLSTRALLPIAKSVFGTDLSEEMLKVAFQNDGIVYVLSRAEEQPFPTNEFDLITVSSGVHWFDIDKFLIEASRILKTDSYLVVYENAFPGEMKSNINFQQWHREIYLKRFPSPPRNKHYDWIAVNLAPKSFALEQKEDFQNEVKFNIDQLIKYLVTQSNIIAAVESLSLTYKEIEIWLNSELSIFFDDDSSKRTFYFNNWIRYIKKVSSI